MSSYVVNLPVVAINDRILALVKAGNVPCEIAAIKVTAAANAPPLRLALLRGETPKPPGGGADVEPSRFDPTAPPPECRVAAHLDEAPFDMSEAGPNNLCAPVGYTLTVTPNGEAVRPGFEGDIRIRTNPSDWIAIKSLGEVGEVFLEVHLAETANDA
ncbi:MAG: hypothetical protein ACTHU0_21250 [Kofleriaceae bacterium]